MKHIISLLLFFSSLTFSFAQDSSIVDKLKDYYLYTFTLDTYPTKEAACKAFQQDKLKDYTYVSSSETPEGFVQCICKGKNGEVNDQQGIILHKIVCPENSWPGSKDNTNNFASQVCFCNQGFLAKGGTCYQNPCNGSIQVDSAREKLLAVKDHVIGLDLKGNSNQFTGCHSIIPLDYVQNIGQGYTYEIQNKVMDPNSKVYTGKPVIKGPDGTIYTKKNNNGKSTFFPDDWDEQKILNEAEHAVNNNQGCYDPNNPGQGLYGYSSDGTVKIRFYYDMNTHKINSFFPQM